MAYSDYGGYGHRNGVLVIERSDCVVTPEGGTLGTPGVYPGYAGVPVQWPSGHVILGDGPVYAVLYKTSLYLYLGQQMLETHLYLVDPRPGSTESWTYTDSDGETKTETCLNTQWYRDSESVAVFRVEGHEIEAVFTTEDNDYVYVKLTQPDGTLWHGWSGYGVGAGHEDYYVDDRRNRMLADLWPEAIKSTSIPPTPPKND